MKRAVLPLSVSALLVCLSSPGAPQTKSSARDGGSGDGSALTTASASTVPVTGTLRGEAHFCGGGARPTEEMIEAAHRSYPLSGVELFVEHGARISAKQPGSRVKTRGDGRFETALAPGRWCVYRASRRLTEAPQGIGVAPQPAAGNMDQACLEELKHSCDAVVDVSQRADRRVQIVISEGCPQVWNQPCYRGPMPP